VRGHDPVEPCKETRIARSGEDNKKGLTKAATEKDSPCQEINYPDERCFSFFSAFWVPACSALGLVL